MTASLPVPPADPRDIETPAARVCAQFYLRAAVTDMRARRKEANAMASYWGGRATAGVVAASAFLMPGTRTHRWPVSGPLERAVFAGRSVEELLAVAESMVPTPPLITASAAEDHAYDFLCAALVDHSVARREPGTGLDPAALAHAAGRAERYAQAAQTFLTRGDLCGDGPVADALLRALGKRLHEVEELRTYALLDAV